MHRPMGQNHTEATGVSWVQPGWLERSLRRAVPGAGSGLPRPQVAVVGVTSPFYFPSPTRLHIHPFQGPRPLGLLASSVGAAPAPFPAQEAL